MLNPNLHEPTSAKLNDPAIIEINYDGMDDLTRRVLQMFVEMGEESLDLHTLFEAGGNDPASRKRVLDIVTRLVDTGYLESRGSDFYVITDKGRNALR